MVRFRNVMMGTLAIVLLVSSTTRAQDAVEKAKSALPKVHELAADPVIVAAVKAFNANPSAESEAMTQEKWKTLPVLDPFVRGLTRNDAANTIKAKKTDAISEAFLSGASGKKVAFLAKTTSWSHKGSGKHDKPMLGEVWIGPVEVDESTGLQQIQVAVPVLDNGTPIGSLVVGFNVSKL